MPNLKEVRVRIQSTISTQQITSVMKMVSASKLRKAQDVILRMRLYSGKLKEIMDNVISSLEASVGGDFTKERPAKNILFVVITSNRGLCGAFNTNLLRLAMRIINEKYSEQKRNNNLQILCIGKKGQDFFRKNGYKIFSSHNQLFNNLNYESASEIAETIMKEFLAKNFDRVELFYNQFKNAASQILANEQFLPVVYSSIQPEKTMHIKSSVKKIHSNYIYDPNQEKIVKEIIPRTLKIQLYKSLLDSHAAEHGARMTAMHKATDNANEILRDLRLSYNKTRQAIITKEILEIVGGAEALKN
ncbi:MAG: ATP synthase F1 subunit gamma [Bacteroidota bacterium]